MSNNLKTYHSATGRKSDASDMMVTAYVGNAGDASVQFTIGDRYCCLDSSELRNLISTLQKRLRRVKKYQATSGDLDEEVWPGSVSHD